MVKVRTLMVDAMCSYRSRCAVFNVLVVHLIPFNFVPGYLRQVTGGQKKKKSY